jgi:mannitol operon transcriptional antiterminator
MSLDKRSTAILMQLMNADSYLSIKALTERLNVSRRTIYYDLDKINDWLIANGLEKVEKVRTAGIILADTAKKQIPHLIGKIEAWHYEYSANERKAWIAIYLLATTSPLYLEHLMEKVRVSRNTTIEDIKALKKEIVKFGLHLQFERKTGYMIIGEEADIRKAIIFYLSHVIPDHNWQSLLANIQLQLNVTNEENNLFQIDTLQSVYQLISECEKKLNVRFTDDVLHSLSLRLVLFAARISQGKLIEMDSVEKEVLRETKAFQAAVEISNKLEELFQTTIPEDEQFYLTAHLLGARINYSEEEFLDYSLVESLKIVAEKMVHDFQQYACILFHDRDLLIKNLLLHLKPAYYRVKYGIEIENEIIDSVKTKYHEIFALTKKVIGPFEQLVGRTAHDNEIAYIAIHFGGWLRKEGATPAPRKRVLVVCANGVGTSQILRKQLEGLFSSIDILDTISVREYEENNYQVDLVISTTAVTKKEVPVIIVNPILTDTEKEALMKKVNALFQRSVTQNISIEGLIDIIQRHAKIQDREKLLVDLKQFVNRQEMNWDEGYKPNLTDLLNEETILFVKRVKDWKEAIQLAAKPLLTNGSITPAYIDRMIDNVENFGPYIVIAPNIAIPHSKPEHGVQKIGMSLLKVEEAVSFSADPKHNVQFIVILASVDNETHLKALSQLTYLFSTKDIREKLMEIKSIDELTTLLRHSNK